MIIASPIISGMAASLQAIHCGFGYRDSVFKHGPSQHVGGSLDIGLAGRALITRVRFRLPKLWRPELGYADLHKRVVETGQSQPSAMQI